MKYSAIAILVASAAMSFGAVKMPKIFSDNMVLQRDMPVKVWGTADANAKVEVEFGGKKKSTKADAAGKWSLKLDKMPADKNPREMTVYENGKVGKKIGNILVGEDWILGGQSNMEWQVVRTTDLDKVVARANYPTMRYFSQSSAYLNETPQKDSPEGSKWHIAKGNIVKYFSGIGFYFGEKLLKDLDVPIALVYASKGATSMIAWIPAENLKDLPFLAEKKQEFDREKKSYTREVYEKALAAHNKKMADAKIEDKELKAAGKPPKKRVWNFHIPPHPLTPWAFGSTPSYLYNSMVSPIGGFAARGAIWYQGEGDAQGKAVKCFGDQFEILVKSWRKNFENPDLYFYWVQLTSFSGNPTWPDARWEQLNVKKRIKNSGVVNILDAGELKEIHPKDKTTVGVRLENLALREVYGFKNVRPYSPEFKSAVYSGGKAEIAFEDFGAGLAEKGEPRGFEILVGGKWRKAPSVKLENSKVVVKSADGAEIEGVRYLWKAWAKPDIWLYNKDGLPAFSFTHKK